MKKINIKRRVSPETTLMEQPSEVRILWNTRNQELEPEVFEKIPAWMDKHPHDLMAFLDYQDLKKELDKLIWSLYQKEPKVIILRYLFDCTLKEIGDMFDLSKERIRQVEAKALRKLKHPTRSDVLQGYL